MIHAGTPLSRCIYVTAALSFAISLQTSCSTYTGQPAASTSAEQTPASVNTQRAQQASAGGPEKAYPHDGTLEQKLHWTFEHGRKLVEQETGTSLDHVTIKIAEEREIQGEVTRVTEKLVSEQFDNPEYADFFLKKIVGDQQGTYAALYVDKHQQVLVSRSLFKAYIASVDHPREEYPAMLALIVHELIHAADDVKYGIHKNRLLSFKASFTQSAAFEGHAQFVTRKICSKNNCLSGMNSLETFMFETTQSPDPVAQSVQAISRNVLEYSYIEGERFLTELSRRPDGAALIDRVLRTPPDDPVQILVPATYPDTARERRNQQLFTTLQPADHVWSKPPWKLVETSPIKGIDVRNDPDRRVAAVEGFTELIVSMTGAQLYNQSSFSISPVDIMLIEAENASTAKLFAESFVNRSVNSIAVDGDQSSVTIDRFENQGNNNFNLYQVSSTAKDGDTFPASVIGLIGPFVVQITTSDASRDNSLVSYARKVVSSVSALPGQQ